MAVIFRSAFKPKVPITDIRCYTVKNDERDLLDDLTDDLFDDLLCLRCHL